MEAKGKNAQSNCNLYLIHLHVQIHCKRMEAYFSQISLSFFNWLFWHSSATSVNFWISCGGGEKKNTPGGYFTWSQAKHPFPPPPHIKQYLRLEKSVIFLDVSVLCVLSHFRCFWLFETLWTAAHPALLFMVFSRQEYEWVAICFSRLARVTSSDILQHIGNKEIIVDYTLSRF